MFEGVRRGVASAVKQIKSVGGVVVDLGRNGLVGRVSARVRRSTADRRLFGRFAEWDA